MNVRHSKSPAPLPAEGAQGGGAPGGGDVRAAGAGAGSAGVMTSNPASGGERAGAAGPCACGAAPTSPSESAPASEAPGCRRGPARGPVTALSLPLLLAAAQEAEADPIGRPRRPRDRWARVYPIYVALRERGLPCADALAWLVNREAIPQGDEFLAQQAFWQMGYRGRKGIRDKGKGLRGKK